MYNGAHIWLIARDMMPLDWMDTTDLSFNTLLLLERIQISWLPDWGLDEPMALALRANPVVEWYMRVKCPQVIPWLDRLRRIEVPVEDTGAVHTAEQQVLQSLNDLLVYVLDPGAYDAQPFLGWDTRELTSLVDFREAVVIDVGAGTGRLALEAAPQAQVVFAVEPVGNLRNYIKEKSARMGFENVFPVDGLITEIPFPDGFADVTMGGHVYGDDPQAERIEMERVTRPGGMVILCPGNGDEDNPAHHELVSHGYLWSRFEEPQDGWKRKYWKVKRK